MQKSSRMESGRAALEDGVVGIVIVAHSGGLAGSVKELVGHLVQGKAAIAAAGGVGDGSFGTSVPAVQEAIDSVYSDDGVVVLMDMGSSLLSAEMALDFMPAGKREKIRLCEAALVEGAVSAAVCAAGGGALDQVVKEAKGALAAKESHLAGAFMVETADGAPGETSPSTARETTPGAASETAREMTLTVRNPLGIHARPAARLVQTASRFRSEITLRNLSKKSGAVSMKSVNLVATLDVGKGESIAVTARGPDAEEALEAVRALVESNFGEPLEEPAGPPLRQETVAGQAASGLNLLGIPCSPGIASGPAVVRAPHVPEAPEYAAGVTAGGPAVFDPAAEWRRLEKALLQVRGEMTALRDRVSREVDVYTGSMYEAFALTLEDPALREKARGVIFGERLNAEKAWALATGWITAKYENATSELLRLRAADLADARDRVLEALAGRGRVPFRTAGDATEPSILVARDLSAADVAVLDTDRVLGICTAYGGAQSHAAILARAVGLPMAAGLGPRVLRVEKGTLIAMDGSTGEVTWDPEKVRELEGRRGGGAVLEETCLAPAVTRDGRRIEVCANVSSLAEIRAAVSRGADGVGVLRTEFLFVNRPNAPSEEEQFTLYESMAQSLGKRPFTVRTLDAGGDKEIPYLSLERENNPFLGVRGIRLSLNNPDFFLEQLRAILRVSAGRCVKVLLPMVSCVEEVRGARELLAKAGSELAARDLAYHERVPLGIMIEVPSAVMIAERLAQEVAFFSIGTNDLTQYTLAADRTNPNVAGLNDALHPAVLRMIERCVKAGHGAGIGVSVCGEMARDRAAVPILLGLGVDGLSMSPAEIRDVKSLIARIAIPDAEALAARALDMESAAAVRAAAGRFLESRLTGTGNPP
jgi:phosphoenolpyruvate-protein phosphotransferase/dihydroxyacetone kinase phosphotransfer subunit